MKFLVVEATIQTRALKTEVEKGEQQLNTGQSDLRDRRTPFRSGGNVVSSVYTCTQYSI